MILYLIKFILCSALFIAAYHLFLEREKANTFKRFYLLASLILALTVPALAIEVVTESQLIPAPLPFTAEAFAINNNPTTDTHSQLPITWVLVCLSYALIAFVLLFRFIKNIARIFNTIRSSTPCTVEGKKLVVSSSSIIPHTFLNFIFISELDSKNKQILAHELTHARQWHSIDILFIEFLHCIFWFNPVLIFFKKAIRLNHEFLADESVISEYHNVPGYQHLLLTKTSNAERIAFASSFNYSITKKRFTMMTTLKNKQRTMIRIASTLVILLATSYLFVNKVSAQAPSSDEYTVYKDGKWQNVKTTNKPGPTDSPAFMKSLQRIVRYPASAKASGIEGDVAVMFEVSATGELTNFTVVKKLQADCEAEVINAIKKSGAAWYAAEIDAKIYPVRFVLPMSFRFDGSKVTDKFQPASVQAKPLNEVVVMTFHP